MKINQIFTKFFSNPSVLRTAPLTGSEITSQAPSKSPPSRGDLRDFQSLEEGGFSGFSAYAQNDNFMILSDENFFKLNSVKLL